MHQPPATFEVNGAAIRTIRMQAGLGVHQLAQVVGVDDSYLRKLETGARTRMRPERYTALRTALNATDTQLLRDPPRGFNERE
ncbi:hypothetical protein GCM10010331_49960 [Streptomyces xanthochromogenes]|uniref:helix-turn-helix domain-containing protein n=1 Tax=Streptomyces xanthochromogenes TaxID=67384 RepID=UPI0016764215|nr:helix-turn-helix transcriptional regulator [Streptomyces xanthochromogenes]GHB56071.1 hypothetical protein GCM10010331_49960 [Streptomyces xanthochromogenes]